MWVDDNAALEVDGREKYLIPAAASAEPDPDASFDAQRRRHDELTNLGLEVVRVDLPRLLGPAEDLRAAIEDRRAAGRLRTFSGRLSFTEPVGKRPSVRPARH